MSAGLHVPVMPFVEVSGRAAKLAPEQMAATGVNVGVTGALTVMVRLAVVAHCPPDGVNV